MKAFNNLLVFYKALSFSRKIIISTNVVAILFIMFYMFANAVNINDGAFDFSHTGIVWIIYLLIIGFYFYFFEIRLEKKEVKYLTAISYEKNNEILLLCSNEGQQYRFNIELVNLLVQNGFLRKFDEKTFEIIQLDNIVLFTTILNRINTLDRRFIKELNDQKKLSEISHDIQWIKDKLGYEYPKLDF